jgi:5-methylcytosine-specific restriction endonuclease McrA
MTKEEKKEHKRRASQQWREDNRERHREYQRNYRLEHPEECKERNDRWNEEHPEDVAGYKQKWNENNPGANNESSANWRRTHPEHKLALTRQRRAKVRNAEGTITKEEWASVLELYGPACLCCGKIKPLTMDHIIPIDCGGSHTIDNVQPLCLSCNSSKGTKTIDYRPNLEEKAA